MVATIFGIVVILAIYYSIKAKDEKQLRKNQELELIRSKAHSEKIEKEKNLISKNRNLFSVILDIEKPIKEFQQREERTEVEYNKVIHAKEKFNYYYSRIKTEEVVSDYTSAKEIEIEEYPAPRDTLIIKYTLTHRWPFKISTKSLTINNFSVVNNDKIVQEYREIAEWCKNNLHLVD